MAATDNSWMPASGRHQVSIGSSLGRALKARKGAPHTKRANIPDRDFYSFRYNFKPESIDSSKPGSVEIKRGRDSTSVKVERSSAQAGESYLFNGSETPAKEWECVLIYDEETGHFALEKMDSFMIINYDKKTTSNNHTSASPMSPQPSWPSASKEALEDLGLEAQLERDLGLEEDAVGEPDDDLEYMAPRQEEEEEEEAVEIPSKPPSPPKSKPQRPPKATAPLVNSKHAPLKGKGKAKREYADTSDGEVENLEFGQQTKRLRPSPPSEGLALPGTFSAPSPLVDPPSNQALPASDSEEDWDEVAAAEPAPPTPLQNDVYIEEGGADVEEIDMTAFEAEMNETLEEDDEDFLAAAVGSEPDPPPSGRPTSLGQFAGGEPSQDEDDYSSSDESDDE